jgi:hypothetical protein
MEPFIDEGKGLVLLPQREGIDHGQIMVRRRDGEGG